MLYQVSDIKSITNQANRKSFIIIITGDNAAPVIESDSWCRITIGQNNLHLHIIEDFLIAWKKNLGGHLSITLHCVRPEKEVCV